VIFAAAFVAMRSMKNPARSSLEDTTPLNHLVDSPLANMQTHLQSNHRAFDQLWARGWLFVLCVCERTVTNRAKKEKNDENWREPRSITRCEIVWPLVRVLWFSVLRAIHLKSHFRGSPFMRSTVYFKTLIFFFWPLNGFWTGQRATMFRYVQPSMSPNCSTKEGGLKNLSFWHFCCCVFYSPWGHIISSLFSLSLLTKLSCFFERHFGGMKTPRWKQYRLGFSPSILLWHVFFWRKKPKQKEKMWHEKPRLGGGSRSHGAVNACAKIGSSPSAEWAFPLSYSAYFLFSHSAFDWPHCCCA